MRYITLEQAVFIHDKMIEKIGGSSGHNETMIGYLSSALDSIKNDLYYPNLEDKIAHLVHSCVKFHPFNDGNKRTAILLADMFLSANDITLDDEKFYEAMEDVVVKVATNELTKENLKEILGKFIKEYTLNN
ncbi:type II toxin-antitoxin system death-on-curing family toxin [Campylobacter mucosalis]|uniref:Fic/DOC family protein n=1 Tax=Campylobacter mucosalis CCUG 21559 TaxID=1032067 RepID=A0A6G5QG88_9BACT|nr:type II toxin-antitoxin system death-on-curing family toxin [Campylobacter mucosalis]QCD44634.1 Fic/DOC family protein [Campylobacter mucosalis CCUG 21559]